MSHENKTVDAKVISTMTGVSIPERLIVPRSYNLNSHSRQKANRSAKRKMVAFLMSTVLPTSSLFVVPAASADSISESAPIYGERVEGFPPEFYEALDNASKESTPEGVAAALFPSDPEAQAEIMPSLREVEAIQKQHSDSEEVSVRAVPAAILPFIAAIGGCVVGALGGAAASELVSKIRHGHRLEAEERVDALIGGCITGAVPPLLRPVANAAKVPIRNAVLALMIRWYQIT